MVNISNGAFSWKILKKEMFIVLKRIRKQEAQLDRGFYVF